MELDGTTWGISLLEPHVSRWIRPHAPLRCGVLRILEGGAGILEN